MRWKKKWTKNQKIMVATLVVAGVLVPFLLHFCPRKERIARSIDTEIILSKVIEEAERKGRAEAEIDQLTTSQLPGESYRRTICLKICCGLIE
jgi:hypothetical protein